MQTSNPSSSCLCNYGTFASTNMSSVLKMWRISNRLCRFQNDFALHDVTIPIVHGICRDWCIHPMREPDQGLLQGYYTLAHSKWFPPSTTSSRTLSPQIQLFKLTHPFVVGSLNHVARHYIELITYISFWLRLPCPDPLLSIANQASWVANPTSCSTHESAPHHDLSTQKFTSGILPASSSLD